MESFANYRERKEFYYGKKIKGLSAFLNVWLPLISVLSVWGFFSTALSYAGDILGLIMAAIYAAFSIFTLAVSRGLDSSTFGCSIAFLIYLFAQTAFSVIRLAVSTSSISNSFTTGTDSAFSAGLQLGFGFALFAEIGALILISIFVVYYLRMFIRHKLFFTKSLSELRKNFERSQAPERD